MTLRKCTEKDLALLIALDNAVFPDAWTELMWQNQLADKNFFGFCAEENGEAIGFVCGTLLFDDGELLKIGVKPDCRGKGVGGLLLNAFLDGIKGAGGVRVFLEVRQGNTPALGLYESRSFLKTRVRERYYADGENALETKKEF